MPARAADRAGEVFEAREINDPPYRKRVYFTDPEGNDWEFVQYSSDDPLERNDYEHPDIT